MNFLRDGVKVSHALLVMVMGWWCLGLARPVETFESSTGYRWFIKTWPHTENGWAAVFGLAAAIGFVGLITRRRYVRLASVTVLAAAHFNLAYGTYEGNNAGMGSGTYSILAALALWRIWREDTQ